MDPGFTIYEAGTSLDWNGDTKVCRFKSCEQTRYFCWLCSQRCWHYGKSKDRLVSLLLWICLESRMMYLTLNIYSSTWQDDWNGAVANKLHSFKSVLLHAVQEG